MIRLIYRKNYLFDLSKYIVSLYFDFNKGNQIISGQTFLKVQPVSSLIKQFEKVVNIIFTLLISPKSFRSQVLRFSLLPLRHGHKVDFAIPGSFWARRAPPDFLRRKRLSLKDASGDDRA